MVVGLFQRFGSDVGHVACNRDQVGASGARCVVKSGLQPSEWTRIRRIVFHTHDTLGKVLVRSGVSNEHGIKARPTTTPDERFEDRLMTAGDQQEPFVLAHATGLASDEDREQRERSNGCHRGFPSRSRAALGRLSSVP
jgi:hypothetical protein